MKEINNTILNKKTIDELLRKIHNTPYSYYYDSSADKIKNKLKRIGLNCSDPAPHQDLIDELRALGILDKQIKQILEFSYFYTTA